MKECSMHQKSCEITTCQIISLIILSLFVLFVLYYTLSYVLPTFERTEAEQEAFSFHQPGESAGFFIETAS